VKGGAHREGGREARRQIAGISIRKLSRDGKVMTIADEGTNRKGEKFSQLLVFERE